MLSTKLSMEQDFYKQTLKEKGITSLIPDEADRDFINNAILTELFKHEFKEATKQRFIRIMEDLKARGAEGIVLGCTEIPLLIKQNDFDLPLCDTLQIHAEYAVDFALG